MKYKTTNKTTIHKCILCANDSFYTLLPYQKRNAVTSDNKIINENFMLLKCKKCLHIQKKIDKDLLNIINDIYEKYTSYYLNNGQEEQKREQNIISNRSQHIIQNTKDIISSKGNILDMGTGTGVFLKEFSKKYKWDLYAQDIKYENLEQLEYFKVFFTKEIDKKYNNYFDIISAIHLFEHLVDIDSFLKTTKKLLNEKGILLLVMPYINENIFDLFTIDHISHFCKKTLYFILKRYFEFVYFPIAQIDRELIVLACDTKLDIKYNNDFSNKYLKKSHINDLLNFISNINTPIAIFGTTPAGLFCSQFVDTKYFLDENTIKIGKKLANKNIIHPDDGDINIPVLFPYSKDLFYVIQKKYPKLNFIYIENRL